MKVDPAKIECMIKWPTLTTAKSLREFLGLTGIIEDLSKDMD